MSDSPRPAGAADATERSASRRPLALLSVLAVRHLTGITLPEASVEAAFRLLSASTSAEQARLLWRLVLVPTPAMRRLRGRAIGAIAAYQAILREAPHLGGLMKLDFTILLGLYGEAIGVSWRRAVAAGLVEVYCHLAALVDAYDDLLDTPAARRQPLQAEDFRRGETGRLRETLVAFLRAQGLRRPKVAGLVDDLAAFEAQAFAGHLALDLAAGLDASLENVVAARAATSGLLLRFAAHLWSVLLDLPEPLAASSEKAAATFGLVAQFADDVLDWTQDDGVAQNLLGAALLAWPEELAAARRAATSAPGRSLPYALLRRVAPRSLATLAGARQQVSTYPADARFAGLRQFGDDVYEALLPALPAVDFRELERARDIVQAVLTPAGPDRSSV